MEKNLTLDPLNAGLFGADTDWTQPRITALYRLFARLPALLSALLAFLFRLPYLEPTRCFHYNPDFYTPEKPGGHRAFRVSTYS